MSTRPETGIPISPLLDSIKKGSTYSVHLMSLHTARRRLITQIDDAKREGTSTASLERDLGANRLETRHFLAYLETPERKENPDLAWWVR